MCGTRVSTQLDVVIGCLWKGKASEAALGGFMEGLNSLSYNEKIYLTNIAMVYKDECNSSL